MLTGIMPGLCRTLDFFWTVTLPYRALHNSMLHICETGTSCRPMEGGLQEPVPLLDADNQSPEGRGQRAARNASGQSANKRHIATEQRRRDKINEGYVMLGQTPSRA